MKNWFPVLLVFSTLTSFGQIPNTLSAADKVYGLSRFWEEVNYNFVYINRIDRAKWDSAYRQMIDLVQKPSDDYQYYRQLERFCALLKDGHTNIYLPESIDSMIMTTAFGQYSLFIENIDGKAIITHVNPGKKDEIPIGSEVVEVNNKPTKDYIREEVEPYISSSTDYVLQDRSIHRLLSGLSGDTYLVKMRKPDHQIITLNLTHSKTNEEQWYPSFNDEHSGLLEFKWYDNRIAYLSLNSFGDPKIDSLFANLLPELYEAKALIIDLRNNGGGSTDIGTNILQYLTNDSLIYGEKSSSRLHIPAFKAWGEYTRPSDTINNEWKKKSVLMFRDDYFYTFDYSPDTIRLKAKRIVVPTAILIGNNTASAAEDFLIYADNQKHIVKVGERTYGSTGQPFSFDLPGGGSARVCTKKDTYPDGREFVGHGIKPDIEVKETLADFIQNKDPVLDKALEYLDNKLR